MDALWAKQPVLTIDGGLGTEIERRGVSINVSVTRKTNDLTCNARSSMEDLWFSLLAAACALQQ